MGKASESLLNLWRRTRGLMRGRTAIVHCRTNRRVSFDELDRQAEVWAARMESASLTEKDRIAVQLPNSADFVAAFIASLARGLVMTPIDSTLGRAETETIMRQVGARALVTSRGLEPLPRRPTAVSEDDPGDAVLLKLTSGSTGVSKGILLTDSQLIADARNICATMEIRPDDFNFAAIPLSHSYGFDNLVLPLLIQGTPMAVIDAFLPRAILDGIASNGATILPAVPVLLEMLGQLPGPLPDVSCLRVVISAGAPLSAAVYDQFRRQFGIKIHQFYGSSECGGITYDRTPPDKFIPGCVGTPMDNVTVDLVEENRVRVRGANVASGYFPASRGDSEILGNGVFLTGDIGEFDEHGRLRLKGRLAGFINVAGRKVDPVEIEACIQRLPEIARVAVIGVADANRNERIVAFVVPAADAVVHAEKVLRHCRDHLASWKVPRTVEILDSFPLNQRGKLDQARLRARLERAHN